MEGPEHSDGDLAEYVLEAGQQMIVDTGYMAGFEESVSIDIQSVQGVKNSLWWREILRYRVLGPGHLAADHAHPSGRLPSFRTYL